MSTDFCFKFYTQELHAHLNGSVSLNTIKKLIEYKKSRTVSGFEVPKEWECSMGEDKEKTLAGSVNFSQNFDNSIDFINLIDI